MPAANAANPPRDARHPPRNTTEGAKRLLQILISESAHLIWVLRWLRVINTRLTDDKIIATKIKRDEKSKRKTRNTWEHILRKQGDLPNDWITSREFLGVHNRISPPGPPDWLQRIW
ncbi:hypothetical protein BJV77DRAFT_968467 [Russula vinacea]|nr:hypothetical protein BJV77DRAFT_968467 [Russula vinacea]